MTSTLTSDIKSIARDEGFCAVGICSPSSIPLASERLANYLELGWHGEMAWMERRAKYRGNPEQLWPAARAVIMLAESYAPDFDPLDLLKSRSHGAVSAYAQNRDYHNIVKKRLKRVGRRLLALAPKAEIKVFVDTAPVMEKPLAESAGIGWIGKHTNLVSRELGSWFFLGAIFTTADLAADRPESDHCGSCTRCLDICPTNAFPEPYKLDSRRCISYLTIEHPGEVDEELRPLIGNRIYGCDDCLAVCPWNKFATVSRVMRYHAANGPALYSLANLIKLTDEQFRKRFSGTPIKRIGRGRMVRNALYALGNLGGPDMCTAVASLANDDDPVVADAARWALSQIHMRSSGKLVPSRRVGEEASQ